MANLLKNLPCISGFSDTGVKRDEGQFLETVYPAARTFGGPGEFGFHQEMYLTEASPLYSPENKQKLFSEWSQYWDMEKPFLLEKSPPNLLKTRFLQVMFLNSYFVVIISHPVAVSYATANWGRYSFHKALLHWVKCHQIYAADVQFVRNTLEVRYEQLIENPDLQMNRISQFLGIESPASMKDMVGNHYLKYFDKWKKEQTNPIKKIMFMVKYRKIEAYVNIWGYSLFRS